MMDQSGPKKISPAQVEVIGKQGEVLKEAEHAKPGFGSSFQFSGMHQFKSVPIGPWMLLLIPVLIPVFIASFFLIAILALFFGRGLLKVVSRNVRK